tara:strand:- start:7215 stop:7868 length:654 start_codon:yes stop_codon:yes gene_type:complete
MKTLPEKPNAQEKEGLELYGINSSEYSAVSDAFRLGMDWAQRDRNTNYTVLKGMIRKGERLTLAADQKADRQKDAILSAINAGEFKRKKHLYQPFGLSMKTLYRAFGRWGMDIEATKQQIDEVINHRAGNRPPTACYNTLVEAIPSIVANLKSSDPKTFTEIVKELKTSNLRLHAIMKEHGINSKKLVKKAFIMRKSHYQAPAEKAEVKSLLSAKWV